MKRVTIAISTAMIVLFGMGLQSLSATELSPEKVRTLDRKMTKKRAKPKRFRTQKEYQRAKLRNSTHKRSAASRKQLSKRTHSSMQKRQRGYVEEVWYDDRDYPRGPRQTGYRHFKRGWYLAYRYDRAVFYDRYGYRYGYFNQYGFYFDGVFYGYDRDYRYRDRLRGRGLFGSHYYMPASAARYGFCPQRPTRPVRPVRPRPFW